MGPAKNQESIEWERGWSDPADVALVGSAFVLLWHVDCAAAARTITAATRRAYHL